MECNLKPLSASSLAIGKYPQIDPHPTLLPWPGDIGHMTRPIPKPGNPNQKQLWPVESGITNGVLARRNSAKHVIAVLLVNIKELQTSF